MNGSSCFSLQQETLPAAIKSFCDQHLEPDNRVTGLAKLLCSQHLMFPILARPECGWTGNPANVSAFIHRYYIQTDKTKDYEDIVASTSHAPVSPETFILPVRLAFENYAEFKSRGYQWADGTREMTNLTHSTLESGLDYRFRADKTEYEIGYQGHIKIYQLTPDLYAHINVATGDFARISAFEQIMFYQRLPDQSTMTVRLEHRKVSSNGLYDLAKRSATELSRDTMEKGFKNATKP